jgi:hypothetical protein
VGASQLTAGRVIVYKNRSGQERGGPRIIPPLRNWPLVSFFDNKSTLDAISRVV